MKGSKHEYFPSTQRSTRTKEGTLLVLPGLLGEKTMIDTVVVPLAHEGFNVMMVGHSRRNRRIHACNEDRSIDVHEAAKESLKKTKGDSTIHLLAHSMGGLDAVHAMEFASEKKDSVPYSVYGYGAIAAVGRNDFTPGAHDVMRELWAHRSEIRKNMNGELRVIRNSLGSLMKNPLLAFFEAISAARADVDEATVKLEQDGVFQQGFEVYGSRDLLVPKPKTRLVAEYEGHHMSPVYTPDIAIEVARFITNSERMAA